jgi:hypothetical protein
MNGTGPLRFGPCAGGGVAGPHSTTPIARRHNPAATPARQAVAGMWSKAIQRYYSARHRRVCVVCFLGHRFRRLAPDKVPWIARIDEAPPVLAGRTASSRQAGPIPALRGAVGVNNCRLRWRRGHARRAPGRPESGGEAAMATWPAIWPITWPITWPMTWTMPWTRTWTRTWTTTWTMTSTFRRCIAAALHFASDAAAGAGDVLFQCSWQIA